MSQTVTYSIQQQVQLRFLCPEDISELKVLCAEWFPIEYPDSWYEDITSNPKFYALAATYSSRIVGIVVSEIKFRSRCNKEDVDILAASFPQNVRVAYILSLGVVEDFRRHGIASLLLDNLLSYLTTTDQRDCKAVYLHVLTSNTTAIHFYERRNFRLHNYLPYYYAIQGQARDGFCYVLYTNGGQPPWTLLDYIKHFANTVSELQPCVLPWRLLSTAQNIWRRVLGVKPPLNQIRFS